MVLLREGTTDSYPITWREVNAKSRLQRFDQVGGLFFTFTGRGDTAARALAQATTRWPADFPRCGPGRGSDDSPRIAVGAQRQPNGIAVRQLNKCSSCLLSSAKGAAPYLLGWYGPAPLALN
jgi:hypothetical protein